MENCLISSLAKTFWITRRWNKINRKTKALTLLAIVAFGAIFVGLAATAFATDTTPTATNTATTTTITQGDNATDIPFSGAGIMFGEQSFGGGPGGMGGHGGHGRGFGGPMGGIEISSAYNQTINNILGNDTDVQKLVSQGYNITSIRPIIKNAIAADGTITAKAATAIVTLQNGTCGYATANVDITNAKVTQITIITRTVIDKSTS